MATIELYKDKINNMSNYIQQAKNAVSDFCVDLSALKSRACSHKNSIKNHGKHDNSQKNSIKFIITSKNFSETL